MRDSFCFVGMPGIEPGLPAPKAGVLPIYDIPDLAVLRAFKLHYFSFRINLFISPS